MSITLTRTVRLIEPQEDRRSHVSSLTLQDFESDHAYVLIGEPGMGKTSEFIQESNRLASANLVHARNLLYHDPAHHPEWGKGTLFIDGLDEVRADKGYPMSVIDKIIARLESIEPPKFRISSRFTHRFYAENYNELNAITGPEKLIILQLNPLNLDEVESIISTQQNNALQFIQYAKKYSLENLLVNPLHLKLLIKSIHHSGWTDHPAKIFLQACNQLISVQNDEHKDAVSSDRKILQAAGQLCALMLLNDKSGWSLNESIDSTVLCLSDVETGNQRALEGAFYSGLFQGHLECRTPIHRTLQEFLAALYISDRVENGLPFGRVLALVLGHDGLPHPDLEGLCAWLASFNQRARKIMIETIPVQVAFNTDSNRFTPEEVNQLLKNLESNFNCCDDSPLLFPLSWQKWMTLTQKLLDSPTRSIGQQNVVSALLRGYGSIYQEFRNQEDDIHENSLELATHHLHQIIYDSSWNSTVRCEAIRILNLRLLKDTDHERTLRCIFHDIQQRRLQDEDHSLHGTLLNILYPHSIKPADIWSHLIDTSILSMSAAHLQFYATLVERSTNHQILELIDSLCDRKDLDLSFGVINDSLMTTIERLIAKGLERFGPALSIEELYRWIELLDPNRNVLNSKIYSWLRNHQKIQYSLILYGLDKNEDKIGTETLTSTVGVRILGKTSPDGFRLWCLTQASELWNTSPKIAEELASWSILPINGWEPPMSDDDITKFVASIPELQQWNINRVHAKKKTVSSTAQQKPIEKNLPKPHHHEKIQQLKDQQDELATAACSPQILHDLAKIYFEALNKNSGDPRSHFISYFGGDEELVDATISGFRSLINRNNLPDLSNIAQLYENKRQSFFALPFVAGMEEAEKEHHNMISRLTDQQQQRAIGFYLTTDISRRGNVMTHSDTRCLSWYNEALLSIPSTVANAMVVIHQACIHSKSIANSYLYHLAFDSNYSKIAKLAIPRMFGAFPTRCNTSQLNSLQILLWATVRTRGMTPKELRKITQSRLKRNHLDIAQQALWLSAGLFASQRFTLSKLVRFLSTGHQSRLRYVFRFLQSDDAPPILRHINDWKSKEISILIQALGGHLKTHQRMDPDEGYDTDKMKAQSLIKMCIEELSKRLDKESAESFEFLKKISCNTSVKHLINHGNEVQSMNRRIAMSPSLSLQNIQTCLHGGEPVNSADLRAITLECLNQLSDKSHHRTSNDWKQYWRLGESTQKPKHEDECTKILLSDIEKLLRKYQIDAQIERRYSDNKRSCIRVSSVSEFSLPIEIKTNFHRDVWRGISEQRTQTYTLDPTADGYAVYLVLWFGANYTKIVPSSGGLPKNSYEMKQALHQHVDKPLKHKISIVVIDASFKG